MHNPFHILKSDPMGALLLILIAYVAITAIDDRFAGGKLHGTVAGFVG